MSSKYIDKFVIMQFLMIGAIAIAAPFTHFGLEHWERYLGVILMIMGTLLLAIAIKSLGPSFTPAVKPTEEGHLVTEGVYSHVRHPIYGSLIFLVFGWAIFWSSLVGVLFSIALMYFLEIKSDVEEKMMMEKYPDYKQYKERVIHKFIPFVY